MPRTKSPTAKRTGRPRLSLIFCARRGLHVAINANADIDTRAQGLVLARGFLTLALDTGKLNAADEVKARALLAFVNAAQRAVAEALNTFAPAPQRHTKRAVSVG